MNRDDYLLAQEEQRLEDRRPEGPICEHCGEPIRSGDDDHYGDDFVEIGGYFLHFPECWDGYGTQWSKEYE